jgi:two-component system, LuxR family, response regulator FixJ
LVTTLIQIVEDDEAIRDSLKLLLESRGYTVEAYGSGSQLFGNGDPARCKCFILDVNLPGDNGFEVLAKVRKKGLTAPAIFVSGRATAAVRAEAARAKAVAFFDKPVPPAELLGAIAAATGPMP